MYSVHAVICMMHGRGVGSNKPPQAHHRFDIQYSCMCMRIKFALYTIEYLPNLVFSSYAMLCYICELNDGLITENRYNHFMSFLIPKTHKKIDWYIH